MKYAVLLGDGMADYPIDEIGGKTAIEAADTPAMDKIAGNGTIGLIDTIPKGFTPGSDVANLSILGYDPAKAHSGRGPLEAASMGIKISQSEIAFRCNLVTLDKEGSKTLMADFTAGHITTDEAGVLIHELNNKIGTSDTVFYPGVGYRNLLVWKGRNLFLQTTPPHDIVGKEIIHYLPQGEGAPEISGLMEASQKILSTHPVNGSRIRSGRRPATSIWLWGQGNAPTIYPLTKRYCIRGAMISAVDLLKGIGVYAGLMPLSVKGATGYTDTNYRGKAQRACEFLREGDFVFVHVEAPDEMGHEGNIEKKIRAIEDFDSKVVAPILQELDNYEQYRIMVLSDHLTPVSVKTHVADPSPFAVYSSKREENVGEGALFGETNAKSSGILISPGHLLMDYFINKWGDLIRRN
ncbi:MAG: cofactor-independent phosphoglycerate mutase [Syntrophales bacterium]|jgi:2,3-bisphosphoglycerate-independent phosphoglycerate mutase|nr:cofactor-independent phosphoglycerate mutase [Syntrophales bacterium]MDY0044162.1 cofactor-independent phosphoglycerate mutase [Syntrophales bacterium]